MMNIKEIRDKSNAELEKMVEDLKVELFYL